MAAFICLAKYPRPVEGIEESKDAHRYACVSDIEGRPADELYTDEVDYIAETNPVYEIAHSPA